MIGLNKNSNKGFTVIEVIVVIGIIAILTVIVFPSINNIRAKNRDAERIADIASIQIALSFYKNKSSSNSYPLTLSELKSGGYITDETMFDPDGKEYLYVPLKRDPLGVCIYYHLGAKLELPNSQIDTDKSFTTKDVDSISNSYNYCDDDITEGIDSGEENMYQVRP